MLLCSRKCANKVKGETDTTFATLFRLYSAHYSGDRNKNFYIYVSQILIYYFITMGFQKSKFILSTLHYVYV